MNDGASQMMNVVMKLAIVGQALQFSEEIPRRRCLLDKMQALIASDASGLHENTQKY